MEWWSHGKMKNWNIGKIEKNESLE